MKKPAKVILIATAGLLVALLSAFLWSLTKETRGDVAATVNRAPIYQSDINNKRDYANLSLKNGRELIEAGTTGMSKEEETAWLADLEKQAALTDGEILALLIREEVTAQEALAKGLGGSRSDARVIAEDSYRQVKEAADESDSAKEAYELVQDSMTENGWSEKEYLDRSAVAYQRDRAKRELKEQFLATCTDPDPEAAYEAYIDGLVERAKVKYKK